MSLTRLRRSVPRLHFPVSLVRLTVLAAVATVMPVSTAWSGPNEDGLLVFHTDDDIVYTTDDLAVYSSPAHPTCLSEECPLPPEDPCWADILDEISPTSARGRMVTMFWLIAIFPPDQCPRVSGASFGLWWPDDTEPTFVDWGACGDFELPFDGWPQPNSGTAVTFLAPQRARAIRLYWFAAYSYYGPAQISLTAFPGEQFPLFADDSVPSALDSVPRSHRGRVGLNGANGYVPWWDVPPIVEASWGGVKSRFREED
ncbi:MAG: hypothetical protein R3E97_04155 [Candidatus Eisenbacteria bacterium]